MTNQLSEMSYVGHILINVLAFVRSKFDALVTYDDRVTQCKVKAHKLFPYQGTRWFVRPESLPGYLYLKAIGFDKKTLFIETSPIDERKLAELRAKFAEPLYDFAQISTVEIPTFGQSKLAPRVLWTIPIEVVKSKYGLLNFLDQIFEYDVFTESHEAEEDQVGMGSAPAVPKQEMKLQLQLMQQLQIEQRPVLSMLMSGSMLGRPDMAQIQAMFAFQLNVLNMSEAELIDFTVKKLGEIGEQRLLQAFTFVIAGRLKKAKPQISWPEARRIARLMQRSPVG